MTGEKKFNDNGHKYVDLGLPSGTLWATMNVGASKPSDGGLYFQWGDTQGYTADQIGNGEGQKKFSHYYMDYKWGKYISKGSTLDLEDDAANANMGGDWHMPTPTQIQELLDNTTNAWTTLNGVNGRLFTSKKDQSKCIFFPGANEAWDGLVRGNGSSGGVLSSMSSKEYVDSMQIFRFGSGGAGLGYGERYEGHSVRGVIG